MRGVILDLESFARDDLNLDRLQALLPGCKYYPQTSPAQLHQRIQDADIVISNKVCLDREAILAASQLKLICVAATGTNNIDIEAATHQGIVVCNVNNYATASVSQHVFMLILALMRRLPDYQAAIDSCDWSQSQHFCLLDYPIADLEGKVMGIIGYGVLGKAVARLAEAFGMTVLISARPGSDECSSGRVEFEELLHRSDVVSLHCPLSATNQQFMNKQAFHQMKPDALLINTARGGLIDEPALRIALMNSEIGGAGLDVLSQEPPPQGHVLLDKAIPNLMITPHIAWASRTARQRLVDEMAENIEAYLAGTPRNPVVHS